MNRSLLALACLALAGCPTTNTGSDSGPRVDAPAVDAYTVPCTPAGLYRATMWTADPANSASCETPSTTEPVRIGASGEPVNASDGAPIACPPSCAPGECTVTNATAPSCSGGLHLGASCTGGSVGDVTYTITGDTATFGFSLISSTQRCVFTGVGERIGS